MLKLLWVSLMFLVIAGLVFIASFGVPIQDAFFEKTDSIVADYE